LSHACGLLAPGFLDRCSQRDSTSSIHGVVPSASPKTTLPYGIFRDVSKYLITRHRLDSDTRRARLYHLRPMRQILNSEPFSYDSLR
jgi:hypothetical protein